MADFVWDVAEIICILKRGGHRGIHPGAIIAMDLLSWLAWAWLCVFIGFGVQSDRDVASYIDRPYDRDQPYDDDWGYVRPEDMGLFETVKNKIRAVLAFSCLTV